MATGRSINTSKVVFIEDSSTVPVGERPKTVTIEIDGNDITQDRVLRIADVDGYLTGLLPGTGWGTSQGGTGLTSWAKDTFAVGSGTNPVYLTNAPQNHGDMLFFDKDLTGKWQSAPMDLSGIEATSARNINATSAGFYSSKLGSELRFKNIAVTGALTLSNDPSVITIGFDQTSLTFTPSQITTTIPVSKGGTGRTTYANNGLLIGGPSDTIAQLPAPTAPGQILVSSDTSMTWTAQSKDDGFPGGLDYPTNGVQVINIKWPYAVTLKEFVGATQSGTLSAILLKNNEALGTLNATTTVTSSSLVGKTLAAGDVLKLTLASVSNVSRFDYTINFTRV